MELYHLENVKDSQQETIQKRNKQSLSCSVLVCVNVTTLLDAVRAWVSLQTQKAALRMWTARAVQHPKAKIVQGPGQVHGLWVIYLAKN